ncbi:hypothetical protein AGDE_13604 [Angomonas deanei]|uniref:Leucine Rich repeat n=1 Tax=Angomonas deanei TaxID=59799 RepID=A0A7G2C8N8_9TRYP|nr:hypothetical protein AGDE_13604 [Angomonas deanei]CAD2214382.1 hypothetical protein, conserved [Angomonas deanei]|eukprot:EPY22068.1 hypothetical protein AGDE_13604 [Angomonas deanei]
MCFLMKLHSFPHFFFFFLLQSCGCFIPLSSSFAFCEFMTDTVSAVTALQEENKWLKEKVNDLMAEKRTLEEEKVNLEKKYTDVKTEYDELVEEHRDSLEEMGSIITRLKAELEEARGDLIALRKALAEKGELVRKMRVTKEMDDLRLCLMEKCYDGRARQFELIRVFLYCKENRVSANVIKDILSSDDRDEVILPDNLNSYIGKANVGEFFETVVTALPNLKYIYGYSKSILNWYALYRRGKLPHKVLEIFCAQFSEDCYELTDQGVRALRLVNLSLRDFLTTALPLMPQVTGLRLPYNFNSLVGDDNMKEFFETIVAVLPNLKSISGYPRSLEHCYVLYKRGEVPRKVLEIYCVQVSRHCYEVTEEALRKIRSDNLSVSEYLTTVLPLLSNVVILSLQDDFDAFVGDTDVKEVLEVIVAALPELKSIMGYPEGPVHCYVQYKQCKISENTLKAYCAVVDGGTCYRMTERMINILQSSRLSVSEYLATVIPLLSEVTRVRLFKINITTLDWCEAMPDRITEVGIISCSNIEDWTPLLKMKGLKYLSYSTLPHNPVVDQVVQELTDKGVNCLAERSYESSDYGRYDYQHNESDDYEYESDDYVYDD